MKVFLIVFGAILIEASIIDALISGHFPVSINFVLFMVGLAATTWGMTL